MCSIRNPISTEIDSNIIKNLLLEFNQIRDTVNVFYYFEQTYAKIGTINLNIENVNYNIIELKNI